MGSLRPTGGLRRYGALASLDLHYVLSRPPVWIWLTLTTLLTFGVCLAGSTIFNSGDSAAGGVRPFITSEVAVAEIDAASAIIFSTFFVCVFSGLSPIRDDEAGVGPILHATPLRISEYVWGKFSGVLAACALITALQVAAQILFNHVLPIAEAERWRGPFRLSNYVVPALVLTVPYLLFLAGISFAVASATREPILIFVLPFAIVVGLMTITSISLDHLAASVHHAITLLEPSGLLYLQDTYTSNDRGVAFYNGATIGFSPAFLLARAGLCAVGLGAVALGQLRLARIVRSPSRRALRRRSREAEREQLAAAQSQPRGRAADTRASLGSLGMTGRRPGVLRGALTVLRVELRALARQPGLYLFIPLIVVVCSVNASNETGMFSTRRILTPGYLAAEQMSIVAVFMALLLLAYTVETLERDRAAGMTALRNALPIRTVSLLLGKLGALAVVTLLPLVAVALLLLLEIARQPVGVPLSLGPFVLFWGVILGPSLLAWTLFVMALYTLCGHNRYLTYALGVLVLIVLFFGHQRLGWEGNLFLLDALHWSDLAPLEFDGPAVLQTRILALLGAVCWATVALIAFRRREPDVTRRIGRLRARTQFVALAPLLLPVILDAALSIHLHNEIARGQSGERMEDKEKDYWRRNFATWQNAPVPAISAVRMSVDLHPESRSFSANGEMWLRNTHGFSLAAIPITPNFLWNDVRWTMNGRAYRPENRAGLLLFRPVRGDIGFAPGQVTQIGFSFVSPDPGFTRNGIGNVEDAASMEFLLPSAVVLTTFSHNLLPQLGYDSGLGVDEDNRYDAADQTLTLRPGESGLPLFGSATPVAVDLTVTAPTGFRVNSVGNCVRRATTGDRETTEWRAEADPSAPVHDFNLVGGRNLTERRGKNGTAVYYYPGHAYNIDEMVLALDSARTWYGAWFAPYPWKELRLTEFPDYAGYAQSFATDITFGEGMGFLTSGSADDDEQTTDAFAVTAHESAHQWWGNMVVPGDGPGSNILSEGLAHYSAAMLIEKVKGADARRAFLREIEREYNKSRSPDSELALARMTSDKKGDTEVTYDKGGWVFTMLSENVMGRENMLRALRAYLTRYRTGTYHPTIADFLAVLRPFAPDKKAFDDFTQQWFYQVVLPQFEISKQSLTAKDQKGKNGVPTHWNASFSLANVGSGIVPVRIALTDDHDNRQDISDVVLTPGAEPTRFQMPLAFKPTRVVVDPDVTVFMSDRDHATANF